jgi:pimeloyl-ACP methyl ester carboxylesterase
VVLVGSSLGGMVAASAEIPADIVSHRVLVDPPLTGGPVRDATMLKDILRLKHRPVAELADYLGARNPSAGRFLLRTMAEMWHEAADGVIEEPLANRWDYFAIDSALRADDAPTLLLQADRTRGGVLTDEQAARALRLLPHGELAHVLGAGHAIHAEKPREFVDLIGRFTRTAGLDRSGYNGPIDAVR